VHGNMTSVAYAAMQALTAVSPDSKLRCFW